MSTVGLDERVIREYIRNQEDEEKREEQLGLGGFSPLRYPTRGGSPFHSPERGLSPVLVPKGSLWGPSSSHWLCRWQLTVLGGLALFYLHAVDFRNADLKLRPAQLLGLDFAEISAGRMSHELRRLRLCGLIERMPKSHRCRVTPLGRRTAAFLTRLHAHLFTPALAELTDDSPLGRPSAMPSTNLTA